MDFAMQIQHRLIYIAPSSKCAARFETLRPSCAARSSKRWYKAQGSVTLIRCGLRCAMVMRVDWDDESIGSMRVELIMGMAAATAHLRQIYSIHGFSRSFANRFS